MALLRLKLLAERGPAIVIALQFIAQMVRVACGHNKCIHYYCYSVHF